jgi:hypothetical protein
MTNTKAKINQAMGLLITAAYSGGEKAVWSIAKGQGQTAELARQAIELYTNPYHNLTLLEAVNIVTQSHI